jgi:hypothetical protein
MLLRVEQDVRCRLQLVGSGGTRMAQIQSDRLAYNV